MKKPNHFKNLSNIIQYALGDLLQSLWKFVIRRQNRFSMFEKRAL